MWVTKVQKQCTWECKSKDGNRAVLSFGQNAKAGGRPTGAHTAQRGCVRAERGLRQASGWINVVMRQLLARRSYMYSPVMNETGTAEHNSIHVLHAKRTSYTSILCCDPARPSTFRATQEEQEQAGEL